MPEGPSIVILTEAVHAFEGRTNAAAGGNSKTVPFDELPRKEHTTPRLALEFEEGGELNFYTCSVKLVEGELDAAYDWRSDVMAEAWSPRLALKKLREDPERFVCDGLLDQNIFSGVGNIIKNEVLFRLHIHPLSTVI